MSNSEGPETVPALLHGRLGDVLATILSIASEGVIVTDERLRILVFSHGAEVIFGYGAAEVIGRPLDLLLPPEMRAAHPAHVARFAAAPATGRPMSARGDIQGRSKTGDLIPIEVGLSKVATPQGLLFTAIVRDVTRQRAAEAALVQAARDAKAASDAKSAFLAQMSHEIRTPLNGVLGMAQAMAQDELPPRQQERLRILRESGEALLVILNDILDISKIESGRLELELVEFDLEGLVRQVRDAFAGAAAQKGLEFAVAVDASAPGVYRGDPLRVRQILTNLISNAIKFTETGRVSLNVARHGAEICFEVRDSGIGISPEGVARLFGKFEQADVSISRRFGGTGLGLAISRQLAELMGGVVSVESAPGAGSAFTARIPLARVSDARSAAAPAPAPPRPADRPALERPLKVLVAEDNPTNQVVIRTLLDVAAISPVIVGDGRAAVAAWESGGFDLVLMDIQMPEMDGVTATSIIRSREAAEGLPRTRILGLTANVMPEQVREYRGAGMDGVLAKPIDIQDLFTAISELV